MATREKGETSPRQSLMPDSRAMKAEPAVQRRFSFATLVGAAILFASIFLAHDWFLTFPNRFELGERRSEVRFEPVALDPAAFQPLRLAGAWKVIGTDPRFGGISALAIDRGNFLALTDSGVVIRFPKPGRSPSHARLTELPDGPGSGGFKSERDSEALVRDRSGRGWWVAFEISDQLWLYDSEFRRPLGRVDIEKRGMDYNAGAEGVVSLASGLFVLPEYGGRGLRLGVSGWNEIAFDYPAVRLSDAVALSETSILLLERRLTPFGFDNALARIDRCPSGYCLVWKKRLPLGVLDNVEAIAIEPLESRWTRLWLMTDDNRHRPLRTLLVAADLPPQD